jgi:hypothetical protein
MLLEVWIVIDQPSTDVPTKINRFKRCIQRSLIPRRRVVRNVSLTHILYTAACLAICILHTVLETWVHD